MFAALDAASASQSLEPPRPPLSVTVTTAPVTAAVVSTDSVGAGTMSIGSSALDPPPGAGVDTPICAVPIAVRSLAGIDIVSCVALT